nr:TlpA family protein disulfide reductase [Saprospiraceae bacterium]
MKILQIIFTTVFALILSTSLIGQRTLPDVDVRTLEGQGVNIASHAENNKITLVTFWATWCVPCRKELDALTDIYEDWKEEFDLEIVAVSIDDTRGMARVRPMVEQNGWDFTIYTDATHDLKNALNFQTIPQSFLLDSDGKIVYSHSGYKPGDEFELEDKIREIAGK